jgi:hypothetical protein
LKKLLLLLLLLLSLGWVVVVVVVLKQKWQRECILRCPAIGFVYSHTYFANAAPNQSSLHNFLRFSRSIVRLKNSLLLMLCSPRTSGCISDWTRQ